MSDLLQKPNINKDKGDRLSYTEINALDNAIDSVIDVINREKKTFCNINLELTGEIPNMKKSFSLLEAIELITEDRRSLGFIIKFLSKDSNEWEEYQYIGTSINSWKEETNWKQLNNFIKIIDGGTF